MNIDDIWDEGQMCDLRDVEEGMMTISRSIPEQYRANIVFSNGPEQQKASSLRNSTYEGEISHSR